MTSAFLFPSWGTQNTLAGHQKDLQHCKGGSNGAGHRGGADGEGQGLMQRGCGEEAVSCGLGEPSPTAWVPEGRAVAPQGIRPPAYIKAAPLDFHERYQLPKALSALTYFVTQSRSL